MAYKVKDEKQRPVLFKGLPVLGQDTFEDVELKDFSNKERSFIAVISGEAPDRMGDIVSVKGWKLENFRKNPVVMQFHNYGALPVGRSLEEFSKKKQLYARPQFAPYPESMRMYEMYRDKYLKGFSVGFVPMSSEPVDPEDSSWFSPMRYTEQELLEYSVAPVPAHQDALAEIKSMVKSGNIYIPARFLELGEAMEIENYDDYFHIVLADKDKFGICFSQKISEDIMVVYGPHKGEDEKENHIYKFIFANKVTQEEATEWVEKNKDKVAISEITEPYADEKYTEKEPLILTGLVGVDKIKFEDAPPKHEEEIEKEVLEETVEKTDPEENINETIEKEFETIMEKDQVEARTILLEGSVTEESEIEEKEVKINYYTYSVDDCLAEEDVLRIVQDLKKVLPENSEVIVLEGGSRLELFDGDLSNTLDKVGAVLNKKNKDKLGKAIGLIEEVLSSAIKEEEELTGPRESEKILDLEIEERSEEDNTVILDLKEFAIEDRSDVDIFTLEEEKPENKVPISKEEVVSLVRDTIMESLGKLN